MTLLRILGGIDFGADREIDRIAEHLARNQIAHELMPAPAAERRWPGMRFSGKVVFHPQAGTVDAERAVEALLAQARRHGAELLDGACVTGLRPAEERAEVELSDGRRFSAAAVVVAAGAWVAPLVDGLVTLPPLTVTQQQIFHFPRLDPGAAPWPSVIDAGAQIYHLAGGRDGGAADDRKLAEHRRGTPVTAHTRSGMIDAASRQRMTEYVARWLPGLDSAPGREATCLYTTTPSEDFILDRVGALVVCSPCSGHGAKFAPLIGELAADLVASPRTAEIPQRFRLSFHRGSAG